MPVVWIVNESGHNFQPAEKFGRLVPLTSGMINHFRVDRVAYNMMQRLALAEETDYILISGSPMLNVIAFQLWLRRFNTAKVLQYSQSRRDYVLRILDNETFDRLILKEKKQRDHRPH